MKKYLVIFVQGFAAMIGFVVSLMISYVLSPQPQFITEKVPASGFLSMPVAMLFNGIVNAAILGWAARRSSFKGLKLFGILFVPTFFVQNFQTQIETGYFLSAFPLLQGNFELYRLILRGFITSALFALLVTWFTGGFSKAERGVSRFMVNTDHIVKHSIWLAVVYFVLYLLFG